MSELRTVTTESQVRTFHRRGLSRGCFAVMVTRSVVSAQGELLGAYHDKTKNEVE